jgi:hypothetical protein
MDPEKPVKLAAKLPKTHEANGLETVHDRLRRHGTAILIMQVTAPSREERLDGVVTPKAEIEWIEGLPGASQGDLGDLGAQLLGLARAERLGEDDGALISRTAVLQSVARRAQQAATAFDQDEYPGD